ncbi:hypothetical protein V8F20_008940 [Naviculisporaceae sp. PSN 640]
MRSGLILGLGLTAANLAAADIEPRMPTLPDQHPQCVYWYDNNGFLTCEGVASNNWISVDEFRQYNPSIGPGCTNLQKGFSYCVEIDTTLPIGGPTTTSTTSSSSTSTSTTSTKSTTSSSTTLTTITTKPTTTTTSTKTTSSSTTTTKAGNGITTPTPLQREIVDNCDAFYMVKENETCDTVAAANGITVAQLAQWNPSIGSTCSGLWANAYACVSIIGHTPTPVSPGNGIQTPSPLQKEIVSNCDAFYMVKQSENCDAVAKANGITVAQLAQWNPSVGSNCAGLWANAYACVSIIGHTPTPVNPGNGIQTPTPLQNEIVSNCDAFYMVKQNENCDAVAKANGITVAQLTQWNPSVGSNCAGLWANAYACVSIIGHTPTPVNPGNGIQTPTPIQDGMTKSCKTFHFVSGQTCQSVLDKYKITMANFYKWNPAVGNNCQNMWDKTYVCVAVL